MVPELARAMVVKPVKALKSAVTPEAPVAVNAVMAVLAAVSVKTPVPDTLTVRNAVSVIPANVVFAVSAALTVANLLLLSVMTPSEPPPKLSASAVGLPVVRPEVKPRVPEARPPVPAVDWLKVKVVKPLDEIVDAP